jgi:LPXTG-motif cell wall-anchored protein
MGKETQIALIGAAVLLMLGWLALFVLRRRQTA